MREEKIIELIESAANIEEAIAILKESGYSINEEQLRSMIETTDECELTENQLECISGGAIVEAFKGLLNRLKGKTRNGQHQGSSGVWHTSGSGRHA